MTKLFSLLAISTLAITSPTLAQRGSFNGYQYRYDNMQYDNSVLSIFSENGEPFYLILNGIKQNLAPQSKVRVEGLPKFQNDVQIVFTDNMPPPIRRVINVADPIDGNATNLYLRISRGGRGQARLRFHRMTECDRNYRGPRDEYVMYYGRPQQINTVSETSYLDPITGQWVTETTTVTTDNNYNGGYYDNGRYNDGRNFNQTTSGIPPSGPRGGIAQAPLPMDSRTLADAKQSISSASFEDTKLSTAKTILNSNWVSSAQVIELCRLFSFENTKVNFAKFAYSRTVDPQNYYKVASVFDFDSNKRALNDFINNGGR